MKKNLDFQTENSFDAFEIFNKILKNNSHLFVTEVENFCDGEVLFLNLQKFINVFVKNNATNTTHNFYVHPSKKSQNLINSLVEIYGKNFNDLFTPCGKSLVKNCHLSISELGIHENSELKLQIGFLPGGGPKNVCNDCGDFFYRENLLCKKTFFL